MMLVIVLVISTVQSLDNHLRGNLQKNLDINIWIKCIIYRQLTVLPHIQDFSWKMVRIEPVEIITEKLISDLVT